LTSPPPLRSSAAPHRLTLDGRSPGVHEAGGSLARQRRGPRVPLSLLLMRAPAPASPTFGRVHDVLVLIHHSPTPVVRPLRAAASGRRGRPRPSPGLLRTMRPPAPALRPGGRGGGLRRYRAAVPPSRQERTAARDPSSACGAARRGRGHLGDRRWNRWSRSRPFVTSGTLEARLQSRESARPRIGARDRSASPRPRAPKTRILWAFGEGLDGRGAVGWGRPEHRRTAEDPQREDPPGR
jgi:hypothetical protein